VFATDDINVELRIRSEQRTELVHLLRGGREALGGISNDEHAQPLRVLEQGGRCSVGTIVGHHLAANVKLGEQKVLAIKGQLPGELHQMIIQAQEQMGRGGAPQALLDGGREEMGKEQSAEVLQVTLARRPRYAESGLRRRNGRNPCPFRPEIHQQALVHRDLAARDEWVHVHQIHSEYRALAEDRQDERSRGHRLPFLMPAGRTSSKAVTPWGNKPTQLTEGEKCHRSCKSMDASSLMMPL
jgi:hypothetical protein